MLGFFCCFFRIAEIFDTIALLTGHNPQIIVSRVGHSLISSIKGKVKKNTSPWAGNVLTFQPARLSEGASCLPPHGLGLLHSRSQLLGFSLSAVFIASLRRSSSILRPTSRPVVRCQPLFYWRLVAYRFFGLSERAQPCASGTESFEKPYAPSDNQKKR